MSLRRRSVNDRHGAPVTEEASSPNGRQPFAVIRPELGVSRITDWMRYQGPEQRLLGLAQLGRSTTHRHQLPAVSIRDERYTATRCADGRHVMAPRSRRG